MFYIINNIDYDKINIKYLSKKEIYKLYYKLNNDIDIIGIPLKLNYNSLKLHYNLIYIYLDDVNVLEKINKIIYNYTGVYIIKYDIETNKRYIVCKNINSVKINNGTININISKLIKNSKNGYVPLIYII